MRSVVRRRSGLAVVVMILLSAGMLAVPALSSAAPTWLAAQQIATHGFGSTDNSYSWSMAWFDGRLYVGTSRDQLCVEGATIDFYKPGTGYKEQPAPDSTCPADRYDLDLRAEIWQYTPASNSWQRVYQSPADIPNPRAPGKFVARDIGFRGMVVHREPDGTEALYIGGVTADEYIPEIAEAHPPRILRTTDGATFTPVNGAPTTIDTPSGSKRPMGFRAMTSYQGRLFVSASEGLTGNGAVLEVKDPAGPAPTFAQVTPASMSAFEMTTFAGHLYVGAGDTAQGYSVWRTDATEEPAQFVPVVTGGAGRGPTITSVVSMQVFRDRLYVGSSGWYAGPSLPASELIRINESDNWELVVGNARQTSDGTEKGPISGLPDGFGNIFNAHFWRQGVSNGTLTVGTNDWSYVFRHSPLVDSWLHPQYGFDAYSTCDGRYWWPSTIDAYGDGLYNFGLRTIVPNDSGFLVGSANHVQGTAVWKTSTPAVCGLQGATNAQAAAPASTPTPLTAERSGCGVSLAWDPVPGVARYRVQRSTKVSHPAVALVPPPSEPDGFIPASPPTPARDAAGTVSVPGPTIVVGVSTGQTFDDRTAQPWEDYLYTVTSVSGIALSAPSNTAAVTGVTTSDDIRAAAADLATQPDLDTQLHALAAQVANSTDAAGIEQGSARLAAAAQISAPSTARIDDFSDLMLRFERSSAAENRGCHR